MTEDATPVPVPYHPRRVAVKVAVAVAMLAVTAYFVWDRTYSQRARIELAYRACMSDLGARDANSGAYESAPKTPRSGGDIGRGVTDTTASLRDRFGGAVCGAVRDACKTNYDGTICQAALRRKK